MNLLSFLSTFLATLQLSIKIRAKSAVTYEGMLVLIWTLGKWLFKITSTCHLHNETAGPKSENVQLKVALLILHSFYCDISLSTFNFEA